MLPILLTKLCIKLNCIVVVVVEVVVVEVVAVYSKIPLYWCKDTTRKYVQSLPVPLNLLWPNGVNQNELTEFSFAEIMASRLRGTKP